MIKNILQDIYHVDVWPMFALVLFMITFTGVALWAFSRKATFCESMCALPLDEDNYSEETNHE